MALQYLASLRHYVPEAIMCLTMVFLIMVESSYDNNLKGSAKGMLYSTAYLGLLSVFVLQTCEKSFLVY